MRERCFRTIKWTLRHPRNSQFILPIHLYNANKVTSVFILKKWGGEGGRNSKLRKVSKFSMLSDFYKLSLCMEFASNFIQSFPSSTAVYPLIPKTNIELSYDTNCNISRSAVRLLNILTNAHYTL